MPDPKPQATGSHGRQKRAPKNRLHSLVYWFCLGRLMTQFHGAAMHAAASVPNHGLEDVLNEIDQRLAALAPSRGHLPPRSDFAEFKENIARYFDADWCPQAADAMDAINRVCRYCPRDHPLEEGQAVGGCGPGQPAQRQWLSLKAPDGAEAELASAISNLADLMTRDLARSLTESLEAASRESLAFHLGCLIEEGLRPRIVGRAMIDTVSHEDWLAARDVCTPFAHLEEGREYDYLVVARRQRAEDQPPAANWLAEVQSWWNQCFPSGRPVQELDRLAEADAAARRTLIDQLAAAAELRLGKEPDPRAPQSSRHLKPCQEVALNQYLEMKKIWKDEWGRMTYRKVFEKLKERNEVSPNMKPQSWTGLLQQALCNKRMTRRGGQAGELPASTVGLDGQSVREEAAPK